MARERSRRVSRLFGEEQPYEGERERVILDPFI
jgi:hypothetical protein